MKLICAIAFCACCSLAFAQGTFENLDFEEGDPMIAGAGRVAISSALPDWTVEYSQISQSDISYNLISTGATQVALVESGLPVYGAIDGSYSVLLQGIVPGSTASISQTGEIPIGTESLQFKAYAGLAQGPLNLEVANQLVSFSAVGQGPNYTLYGANISAWSGQTASIAFSAPGGSYNNWEIDDISFSPYPILLWRQSQRRYR